MLKDFQITNDAGETLTISRTKLEHVEKEVYDRVRPAKFREILKIDTSVPWWAEQYSYDKIVENAQWLPAQEFTEEFATATTRIEAESFKLYEMVSGYRFNVRELARAQQLGVNLDSSRALAVTKKGEMVLENLAADGTIDGESKNLGNLKGLYNTVGATTLSTELQGYTQSWELKFAAATTGDTWDAACEVVISDLLQLETRSLIVTKETTPIDMLVLPLSVRNIMQYSKRFTSKKLHDELLDRSMYVTSIVYWNKPDSKQYGVDAAHSRRIVGLASGDLDAARFVLPRAPMPGRPVQLLNGGIHTPVNMVLGGFNTKMASALIYADLDNAA